jgi:hypothetical protein
MSNKQSKASKILPYAAGLAEASRSADRTEVAAVQFPSAHVEHARLISNLTRSKEEGGENRAATNQLQTGVGRCRSTMFSTIECMA